MASGIPSDYVTRFGRKIRPTEKVQQIFEESMKKGFRKAVRALENRNDILYDLLKAHPDYNTLKTVFITWIQGYKEVLELESEFVPLLNVRELREHRKKFPDFIMAIEQLKSDAESCLVMLKKEDKTRKKFLKLRVEEERLRKEISKIETELTTIEGEEDEDTDEMNQEIVRHARKSSTQAEFDSGSLYNYSVSSDSVKSNKASSIPRYHDSCDDTDEEEANTKQLNPSAPIFIPTIPKKEDVKPTEDPALKLLGKLAELLQSKQDTLPQIELEPFDGDLLQFPEWWSFFKSRIEQKAKTEQEKLFFLGRYTTGRARDSIRGILSLHHDEDAYNRAKSMLLATYGEKSKISEAFKKKLRDWQNIKKGDGEALQKFSNFLWQCHSAMSTMSSLSHLNSKEENIKLLQKLPQNLAERWDRKVDSFMYKSAPDQTVCTVEPSEEYPSFLVFCKFLSAEARVWLNGSNASRTTETREKETRSEKQTHRNKHTAFFNSSDSKESRTDAKFEKRFADLKCHYCRENHFLSRCTSFLEKSGEEKKAFCKERGICFGCCRRGHIYKDCPIRNGNLMKDGIVKEKKSPKEAEPARAQATAMRTLTNSRSYSSMIVPVEVFNRESPLNRTKVYALIDTQADCCFIQKSLAKKLSLKMTDVSLELVTMGNKCLVKSEAVFGITVQGVNEGEKLRLPQCYTRPEIPADRDTIPNRAEIQRWDHLKEIGAKMMDRDDDIEVGLLLGYNCPEVLLQTGQVFNGWDKPFAVQTMLGWAVLGNVAGERRERSQQSVFKTAVREVTAVEIKKVFDVEVPFTDEDDKKMSYNDIKFMEIMEREVKQCEDKHIELPLPLKKEPENMPNNRSQAMRRLMSTKKKFARNPTYHKKYTEFVTKMLHDGHAEEVPFDELKKEGLVWYWSHQGVEHPRKPDKVRVVWDGSAEFQGFCLNNLLMSGPDLTNSLTGVLIRFREEKIAIVCDVEGMFHQVRVTERHRNLLRFLWFEDGNTEGAIKEYRMTVHLFGATSSPGCANFAFKHVARKYSHKYGKEVERFITRHFYVDDGLASKSTVKKAVELVHSGHNLCKEGGFNLTKFASSNKEVLAQIPKEMRAKEVKDWELSDHQNLPTDKTLGMSMDMEQDCFVYQVMLKMDADTRRLMLSSLSSIYDPLGLISPVFLEGRNLLQKLCIKEFAWDDKVDYEVQQAWNSWYKQLEELNRIKVPRSYKREVMGELTSVQLHMFSDASQSGYGACAYVRLSDGKNTDVTLVMAKSKVLPTKQMTIPRSELQAAVLAVILARSIESELTYENVETHYWTDSRVVLGYLANADKRFHLFVTNRIHFIRERSEMGQWHYVRTEHNPADLASRGVSVKELAETKMWWSGPMMLREASSEVKLEDENFSDMLMKDDAELKKSEKATVNRVLANEEEDPLLTLTNASGDWESLVSKVTIWMKFKTLLRNKAREKAEKEPLEYDERISVEDRRLAEVLLIKNEQGRSFKQEVKLLKRQEFYPTQHADIKKRNDSIKKKSNLYKLDVFVDENDCMRVGGRISRSKISREAKEPVVLPGDSRLTTLIIRHCHNKCHHGGRGTTHNRVRAEGYWILGGRNKIDQAISKCVTCQQLRGMNLNQKMCELPEDRIESSPPFTYCSVDYFGPYEVKEKRSMVKVWICIFVCQVSRAVHLEVSPGLATDNFLNCYRRFVNRRGPIRTLRCDRGTNFIGARTELNSAMKEMNMKKIERCLLEDRCDVITFRFNVPKASHMGGSWERMIRIARNNLNCLMKTHGHQLNMELFTTLTTEVEAVMNARPLTCVDLSDPRCPIPLTPSNLLTMKSNLTMPLPGIFPKEDVYSRRQWRRVCYLADQFWHRWRREILPYLQERSKWQDEKDNVRINDIVMLTEPDAPRNRWEKGRIVKVSPDEDGLVRKVTVKTEKSELERPIHKLVMLYRPENNTRLGALIMSDEGQGEIEERG